MRWCLFHLSFVLIDPKLIPLERLEEGSSCLTLQNNCKKTSELNKTDVNWKIGLHLALKFMWTHCKAFSLWLFLYTWANLQICKDTYICTVCACELHLNRFIAQHFAHNTKELIYLDSNTQETMKKQMYPSDSSHFPPLNWGIPKIFLTVTQTFTCNFYVYYAQNRSYTV